METYTVYLNWKTQYCGMSPLPKLIYRFNNILIKITDFWRKWQTNFKTPMKIQNWISSILKTLVFERYHWESEKSNHELMKIFLNHVSDKELVSKIYKETSKLNNKEINDQLETYTRIRIDFTKENKWKANKHIKIWSTSLVIRETQIKNHEISLCWTLMHCW